LLTLFAGWPLLLHKRWLSFLLPLLFIGILAFFLSMSFGHGDLPTALFGTRVLILHVPLIFIFASVFDRSDVLRFAWSILFLSIPMAMLIVFQSELPDTHFLNVGIGGAGTSVFDGAGGRFRPSGTFSFNTGVGSFFSLAAASLFALLYAKPLPIKQRLFCAFVCFALVIALPFSMSRGLLAGYLQVLTATFIALILSRSRLISLLSGVMAIILAFIIASNLPAFNDASTAFLARWEIAGLAAGTDKKEVGHMGVASTQLQARVLGSLTGPLGNLGEVPLLGYGIGLASNFGAIRSRGTVGFFLGETPWDASLAELGLPLGLTLIAWRVALSTYTLFRALRAAIRENLVPLILTGSSFGMLGGALGGGLSQPTDVGFLVLTSGLTLSSFQCASRFSK
jgi:hypothetical protein